MRAIKDKLLNSIRNKDLSAIEGICRRDSTSRYFHKSDENPFEWVLLEFQSGELPPD
jgi:hypothetical protein